MITVTPNPSGLIDRTWAALREAERETGRTDYTVLSARHDHRLHQHRAARSGSTTCRTARRPTAQCLIEHPNRKGEGFKFIGDNKPKEEAADVFRFELALGAKKDTSYTVIKERPVESSVQLTESPPTTRFATSSI